MRITDKSIIVTGAGSGIGRAAARAFAAKGDRVTFVDLTDGAVVQAPRDEAGIRADDRLGDRRRTGSGMRGATILDHDQGDSPRAACETRYAAVMETLTEFLKWAASISGMIAAFMVSLDSGRRVTGWGFVLFVASSLCWISGAGLTGDWALGTQNVVLFGINLFGTYRYLIRKTGA